MNAMDALTRTVFLALISVALVIVQKPVSLLVFTAVGMAAAVQARVPRGLLVAAVLAPALPTFLSYAVVYPVFGGHVGIEIGLRAFGAWVRLSGLSVWSLAWVYSLSIADAAQIAKASLLSQYALVPLVIASSLVDVMGRRWTAIREVQMLARTGSLRERRRVRFSTMPTSALQLILASFVSAKELSLAAAGRGIGVRRILPIELKKASYVGIAGVMIIAAIIVTQSVYPNLLP